MLHAVTPGVVNIATKKVEVVDNQILRDPSCIGSDNESDDEHEENEDLRESWTPRFRR
jgi:hypothetical protein